MNDTDRYRLLFGPYTTPLFQYGDRVFCERIGDAIITRLSNGPIPWPIGKRPGRRCHSILLYGPLVQAVLKESAQAVAYWWGVGSDTIWKWRKALGVEPNNVGTLRLRHKYALEPGITAAREKAHAKSRDGRRDRKRRQKIAAARRGKPRPPHVVEAIREANRSREVSDKTRKKMSQAQKARGTRPPKAGRPWTEQELAILAEPITHEEAALRTGRTRNAVRDKRAMLARSD